MLILGLCGSLRRRSDNRLLLLAAQALAPAGVEVRLWEGLGEIPPYDEDADADAPSNVAEMRGAFAGADALLIATPEYNASIPGQLKNALDWASRPYATNPLRGKPVGVIGVASGSSAPEAACRDLVRVLDAIGAAPVDSGLVLGRAHEHFDEHGRLRVGTFARRLLRDVIDELIVLARAPMEAAR